MLPLEHLPDTRILLPLLLVRALAAKAAKTVAIAVVRDESEFPQTRLAPLSVFHCFSFRKIEIHLVGRE